VVQRCVYLVAFNAAGLILVLVQLALYTRSFTASLHFIAIFRTSLHR